MSATNDLIEQHLDQFYQWVGDKKYEEAMDWCCDLPLHGDDDHEEIVQRYIEDNPELIHEYIKTLPEA